MNGFFKHAGIRFRATLRAPFALTVLLLSGLVSLFYWPGLAEPSGVGWPGVDPSGLLGSIHGIVMMIFWMFMWPMLVANLAGGRTVGCAAGGRTYVARPMPALPVGPSSRALAEAAVVLTFVFMARLPGLFLGSWAHDLFSLPGEYAGDAAYRLQFAGRSIAGALVMLPLLLIWAAPARTIEAQKLRPLIWIGLLLAALKIGLLQTFAACAATSVVLSALALLLVRREYDFVLPRRRPAGRPDSRHRAYLHPERQLRRDQWLRPLPMASLLVAAELVLVTLHHAAVLPRLPFLLASIMVGSSSLSFVALRPMGSKLVVAGVWGAPGHRAGDFARAWSVLPVRREALVRGVYLHAFIACTAIVAGILGVISLTRWLETGSGRFIQDDLDFMHEMLLPLATMIPCMASFVAAGSVGNRWRAYLGGGAFLLIVHLNIALLILGAPHVLRVGTVLGLALAGSLPALVLLRSTGAANDLAPATAPGSGAGGSG
jgi:hypothetical protein